MKRVLSWTALYAVSIFAVVVGAWPMPAAATDDSIPVTSDCLSGWYVNADEAADAPKQTAKGLLFEGKDLVHHKTEPMDLPDVKPYTGSFEATVDGKVVFKMETSNPYSTIIQNADGKFWSTAMTYAQEGGQGFPVENVSDLIGKPTKPGKVPYGDTSKVVTFGVGYWVEEGATIVTSITFHGTKYDLSCQTKPTPPAHSPTAKPTVKPTPSNPAHSPTVKPTIKPTTSAPTTGPPPTTDAPPADASEAPVPTPVSGALPVTGEKSPMLALFLGGLGLLAFGSALLLWVRRRSLS